MGGHGDEVPGRAGGQRVSNEDLGMDGGAGPQTWMEFRVGEGPHREKDRDRRSGAGRGTELGDPGSPRHVTDLGGVSGSVENL